MWQIVQALLFAAQRTHQPFIHNSFGSNVLLQFTDENHEKLDDILMETIKTRGKN